MHEAFRNGFEKEAAAPLNKMMGSRTRQSVSRMAGSRPLQNAYKPVLPARGSANAGLASRVKPPPPNARQEARRRGAAANASVPQPAPAPVAPTLGQRLRAKFTQLKGAVTPSPKPPKTKATPGPAAQAPAANAAAAGATPEAVATAGQQTAPAAAAAEQPGFFKKHGPMVAAAGATGLVGLAAGAQMGGNPQPPPTPAAYQYY